MKRYFVIRQLSNNSFKIAPLVLQEFDNLDNARAYSNALAVENKEYVYAIYEHIV